MPILPFIQSVSVPQDAHTAVEAVVFGAVFGVSKFWDHVKGKRRDHTSASTLRAISNDVREVRDEVRDLKAHVVGPDGQNGIRGDVRELKDQMGRLRDKGLFQTPPEFPAQRPAKYEP